MQRRFYSAKFDKSQSLITQLMIFLRKNIKYSFNKKVNRLCDKSARAAFLISVFFALSAVKMIFGESFVRTNVKTLKTHITPSEKKFLHTKINMMSKSVKPIQRTKRTKGVLLN